MKNQKNRKNLKKGLNLPKHGLVIEIKIVLQIQYSQFYGFVKSNKS